MINVEMQDLTPSFRGHRRSGHHRSGLMREGRREPVLYSARYSASWVEVEAANNGIHIGILCDRAFAALSLVPENTSQLVVNAASTQDLNVPHGIEKQWMRQTTSDVVLMGHTHKSGLVLDVYIKAQDATMELATTIQNAYTSGCRRRLALN